MNFVYKKMAAYLSKLADRRFGSELRRVTKRFVQFPTNLRQYIILRSIGCDLLLKAHYIFNEYKKLR